MLSNFLLGVLLVAHTVWTAPVHHHSELTPHVVIVTPQAQLQLDSFPHGTPIFQHLTPYTRFVAPHEETIVYVPASAIGSHPVGHITIPTSQHQYESRSTARNILGNILSIPNQAVETITSGTINPSKIIESTITGVADAAGQVIDTIGSPSKIVTTIPIQVPGQIIESIGSPNKLIGSIASPLPIPIIGTTKLTPSYRQTVFENIQNAIQNPSQVLESIQNAASNPTGLFESVTNSISGAVTNLAQNSPCDSLNSIAQNTGLQQTPTQQAGSSARSIDKGESQDEAQSQDLKAAASQPQLTTVQHVEYEIPITPIISHEARQQLPHYASVIGPALPHVVDYIQTPIFLAPSIPTVKGRSLSTAEEKPQILAPTPIEPPKPEAAPIPEIPAIPLPENLPLKPELDKLPEIIAKEEIIPKESARSLEAALVKGVQSVVEEVVKQVDQVEAVKPILKSVAGVNEVNDEPQSKVA
ncbi:uncharacterized protein [Musca autumnalis]|uniref:uncharacterized protein n=1 Tax=Musca autumnalis TaxID=221902 RepID=UPI003CEEDDD1